MLKKKVCIYSQDEHHIAYLKSFFNAHVECTVNPRMTDSDAFVFVDPQHPRAQNIIDECKQNQIHTMYVPPASELEGVNASLKSILSKMEQDLNLVRKMQSGLIPQKFPKIPGFSIKHKYLAGMKSGGDYLDVFEFDDKNHVGILMSDSTGYGLSSAFMSVILRLAFRFHQRDVVAPSVFVKRVFQELHNTMKDQEDLSLFYGILDRRTLTMKYVAQGHIRCFLGATLCVDLTKSLRKGEDLIIEDHELQFNAGDRFVLLTDGFVEGFSSDKELSQMLKEKKEEASLNIVNELAYRVKKNVEDDDFPAQDCSVIVLDVEKHVLRLAK